MNLKALIQVNSECLVELSFFKQSFIPFRLKTKRRVKLRKAIKDKKEKTREIQKKSKRAK